MSDTVVVAEDETTTVVVAEETTVVVVSAPGPQGPPGPTGAGLASHLVANPAHIAARIEFNPEGGLASENVQDAIVEASVNPGYLHSQGAAAFVWPINHDRHSYPSGLYVEESTGDELLGYDRQDPDPDNTILTFPVQVSGFVRLK